MDNEFSYEIGGKAYIQRPLVLGQMRQLMTLMDGVIIIPETGATGLAAALGDKLSQALAIVLVEEGATLSLKDRNIEAIADDLEYTVTLETTMQVVEDFFICNPIASSLERLTGMMIAARRKMVKQTGLKKSASSSAEEISPKEMPSSGDTPQKSASPGSDTVPEM